MGEPRTKAGQKMLYEMGLDDPIAGKGRHDHAVMRIRAIEDEAAAGVTPDPRPAPDADGHDIRCVDCGQPIGPGMFPCLTPGAGLHDDRPITKVTTPDGQVYRPAEAAMYEIDRLLVTLTCCGRADGCYAADSWAEAQAFREAYTSGPGVKGGHVGDTGHDRSAVITSMLEARPVTTQPDPEPLDDACIHCVNTSRSCTELIAGYGRGIAILRAENARLRAVEAAAREWVICRDAYLDTNIRNDFDEAVALDAAENALRAALEPAP